MRDVPPARTGEGETWEREGFSFLFLLFMVFRNVFGVGVEMLLMLVLSLLVLFLLDLLLLDGFPTFPQCLFSCPWG